MNPKQVIDKILGELPEEIKSPAKHQAISDCSWYTDVVYNIDYYDGDYLGLANALLQQEKSRRELLASNIEALEFICDGCRLHNPQHADCTWCNDHEQLRATVESQLNTPWNDILNMLEEG